METLSSIREEFKRLEILIFYYLGVLDVGKFYEATFMDWEWKALIDNPNE